MTAETERERIRSYLVSQAEKKTFAELRPAVEEGRNALYAALDGIGEEQARFKPPGGEGEDAWSIHEVLRHVIQGKEGVALRVRALALGDPARGSTPGRLVGRADASLADLVRDLQAADFALEHAVGSVEGRERLDTTAPHAFFGELNCRAWFLFQRIHDLDHARQIEKIKAMPGFPP
ncbi:MAG TPA: DinB family protein [Dehalococcoidia bacterium]|nr:DinB family protein [Dehalococcoidia bacterium]